MKLPELQAKFRFLGSVGVSYALTLLLLVAAYKTIHPSPQVAHAQAPALVLPEKPQKKQPQKKMVKQGEPQQLLIPRLGLTEQILPGTYDIEKKSWSLSDTGVHFAEVSSRPNDTSGNTLLYAHNNRFAFGPLYGLKPGDEAHVITEKYVFYYTYQSMKSYQPDDVSVLTYSGPAQLQLQTCGGAWYERRDLFSFALERVEARDGA